MTKRFEKLSELIPKMVYSDRDLNILANMLEDQTYRQMQAQFDEIKMEMKEFQFKSRDIRRIIVNGTFFKYKEPGFTLTEIYTKILKKYPRIFLALCMPIEKVPLFISRDYLGLFMRWRLLIQK